MPKRQKTKSGKPRVRPGTQQERGRSASEPRGRSPRPAAGGGRGPRGEGGGRGPARRGYGGPEREGKISLHARGFGFVVTPGEDTDVFIPPDGLSSAMHGDRVRIQVERSPKGLSGRVIEVLERAVRYVGGQLHLGHEGGWLDPDDERLRMPILVRGDLPEGARTGQGALAQVLSYPEHSRDALYVRVVEVFEPEAFVDYEIRRILLKESVREGFDPDAEREASELPAELPPEAYAGREDLRHLDLLTIDPADARDHDDAVWAERIAHGGFRIVVAIADVSHYVPEGSALDREALERGCTIYLPTRAIPMLPGPLSSNLASLLSERDRLTLAVDIELDASGTVQKYRFIEGVMRARACLPYEAVARALGLYPEGPENPHAIEHLGQLQVLLEVSGVLREVRRQRGSLELELPEPKVRVDDETRHPIDVERSRRHPGVARAYNLIEEMMLLANEVVARDLAERGAPAIFRVHGPPDPDRIETFCTLASAIGYPLDPEAASNPMLLAAFLRRIHGTPQAGTLGYLMLRAMQQAVYATENKGHFGLAAEHYLHFTSPIRRYPDLAVHRVVRRIARGENPGGGPLVDRMQSQAEQSSLRERRAMAIEREVVDLYGAFLMRDRVGETFEATVSGVTEHGFYATLDAPFVDVLCRVAWLQPDVYELDAYGVRLTGQNGGITYGLGDRVRLVIQDVSIAQRKVLAAPHDSPQALKMPGVEAGPEGAQPEGDTANRARSKRRERQQQREQQRKEGRTSRKQRKPGETTPGSSGPRGKANGKKGRR